MIFFFLSFSFVFPYPRPSSFLRLSRCARGGFFSPTRFIHASTSTDDAGFVVRPVAYPMTRAPLPRPSVARVRRRSFEPAAEELRGMTPGGLFEWPIRDGLSHVINHLSFSLSYTSRHRDFFCAYVYTSTCIRYVLHCTPCIIIFSRTVDLNPEFYNRNNNNNNSRPINSDRGAYVVLK